MHYSSQLHEQVGDFEIKVPAVNVIVLNDDAQLLVLKPQNESKWMLPWGELEAEETVVDAAIRIAKRETGLELLEIECVGFSSANRANHVRDKQGMPQHLHLFTFVSTYFSGHLSDNPKFSNMDYFSINDVPELVAPFRSSLAAFKKWLPERMLQID